MVRLIHTADLHLGIGFAQISSSADFEEKRFRDFISNLEFIKNYALNNKADFFVIAGDVFHNPRPSIQAFNEFSRIVGELIKNKVHVLVVIGNHDSTKTREALSYLKSYDNLGVDYFHLFDTARAEVIEAKSTGEKIKFIGLPYPHFQSNYSYSDFVNFFEQKLSEITKDNEGDFSVIIGHLYVEGGKLGSEQRIASLRDYPIPPRIFEPYDLTCLGHLHTPQRLGSKLFYSGSIERVDFGEEGEEKSFLDIKLGSKLEVNKVSLKLRPMKTYSINATSMSHSDLINEIKSLVLEEGAIVRIRIRISSNTSYPPVNQIERILKERYSVAGFKIDVEREEYQETRLPSTNLDFYSFLNEYLKARYKDRPNDFLVKVFSEAKKIIDEAQSQ